MCTCATALLCFLFNSGGVIVKVEGINVDVVSNPGMKTTVLITGVSDRRDPEQHETVRIVKV